MDTEHGRKMLSKFINSGWDIKEYSVVDLAWLATQLKETIDYLAYEIDRRCKEIDNK